MELKAVSLTQIREYYSDQLEEAVSHFNREKIVLSRKTGKGTKAFARLPSLQMCMPYWLSTPLPFPVLEIKRNLSFYKMFCRPMTDQGGGRLHG